MLEPPTENVKPPVWRDNIWRIDERTITVVRPRPKPDVCGEFFPFFRSSRGEHENSTKISAERRVSCCQYNSSGEGSVLDKVQIIT
jgi:hypothetical protein